MIVLYSLLLDISGSHKYSIEHIYETDKYQGGAICVKVTRTKIVNEDENSQWGPK